VAIVGRIYKRGDRGFHGYGRPLKDSNGGEIEVYESSLATGPRVWLKIDSRSWDRDMTQAATAHLDQKQARAVIARLQAWLDEVPTRWGKKWVKS